MSPAQSRPRVVVRLWEDGTDRRLGVLSCGGCGRRYIRNWSEVHDLAIAHAGKCAELGYRRAIWDVRDHAELLRVRAAVLLAAVGSQTRMTLPWVELRKVADELDELTGLVRRTEKLTGEAMDRQAWEEFWAAGAPAVPS